MSVNPNDHIPIYEQIVQHVCGAVAAGVYHPGEVLPSIRSLALELVVNPNTVQRAYQELERLGLVEMRKGLGVFVARNGSESARNQSVAAVAARFLQGVKIARAAKIPSAGIETIFRGAMTGNGTGPSTDKKKETTPPAAEKDEP